MRTRGCYVKTQALPCPDSCWKMAGVVLSAQSSLPSRFSGRAETKTNPAVVSFEKELSKLLKSADNKSQSWNSHQKLSEALFTLWNSHQAKLPAALYTRQLLAAGDVLYKKGCFSLASVHCYGRYLTSVGVRWSDNLVDCLLQKEVDVITATLRATIGNAMCHYYEAEEGDPVMLLKSTRTTALSVLQKLQQVSQVALSREPLYWLVYNALVLVYSISRRLMQHGHSLSVLEYLLWGAVCMESSVPLMALKYLQLRVNFYVAVCQCYWDVRQPHHAELFARRGLGKVHELAQLEHQSSTEATDASELIFKEASVKLGVMVFKRSALETRKKTKSVFRPKVRPTIKDLLQIPSPRSPTEKLLFEMFSGQSAQFLAVLEFLSDSSRRPLEQAPPSPITELDHDTITDVYQEVFCIGTELSLRALEEVQHILTESASSETADNLPRPLLNQRWSLMSLASKGAGRVPLDAVVKFVRVARSYNQKEVVEMLAEHVVKITKLCEDEHTRSCGEALEIIQANDALRSAHRKYKAHVNAIQGGQASSSVAPPQPHPPPTAGTTTTAAGSTGQQTLTSTNDEGGSIDDLFERLQHVLHLLHSSCISETSHALPLVTMDYDLLLDTLVIVWEVLKPALAKINSHAYLECRQFLTNSTGNQYLQMLTQLVEVAHSLHLWQTDPLLHGELRLKLACLYEARAELKPKRPVTKATSAVKLDVDLHQMYDRQRLLECLYELSGGVECVGRARSWRTEETTGERDGGKEMGVLHAEYMYAMTRVKIKLASTIPPPPPAESTQKPSSLRSKVKAREERQRERENMLSELTAPTVPVEGVSQLRAAAGKNPWSAALVSMLLASTSHRAGQADRERLINESYQSLLQEQQRLNDLKKATDRTSSAPTSTSSSPLLLPPPVLIVCNDHSMTFAPPKLVSSELQDSVVYYKLFGRVASGSNVKVRLTDKNYPGLGVAVPARDDGTVLKVKGLQANESYVFAIGAYGRSGEIVGGSIGLTGRALVACCPLPMLMLWGYLCQCAYVAGVGDIASSASAVMWKHFVHTPPPPTDKEGNSGLQKDDNKLLELHLLDTPLLSSTPSAILRHFVQSIIIDVQLSMAQGSLFSDRLCTAGPLKPSQLARLELILRLSVAVRVAGFINDPSLCLQTVVLCLGLASPLVHHSVTALPLLETLLYCHAVLNELPEHILISCKDSACTASLHHLIAATAYYVGKVILAVQKKTLFTSFTNNARGLLLSTMQAATDVAKEMESEKDGGRRGKAKDTLTNAANLEQPSLLVDPAITSYSTMRSALGNLLPPKGADRKKKGRKKLIAATEQLSDEAKSSEYKAFEAFLMSSHSHQGVDDLDLTGQEDPVILHAVIANLPSQQAYKEVHKFRRRPQYLEFLVHLSSLTLSRGGQERVMGWIQEAFQWLRKRNELLLSPKLPQHKPGGGGGGAGGGAHGHHQKGRAMSARGSTTALVQAKASRRTSLTVLAPSTAATAGGGMGAVGARESKAILPVVKEGQRLGKDGTSASKAILASGSQHGGLQKTQGVVRRPSAMGGGKRLVPATSRNLDVSLSVKITRDDIEYKAHVLVATLLPELWRKHKSRKRLRSVCAEELPWRSQANLIQATCHLDMLLGRLGVAEATIESEPHPQQPHGLTFDAAGVIIDRVLPLYSPVVAGAGDKKVPVKGGISTGAANKNTNSLESLFINDVKLIMKHLQCAIVLASRGKHWTLLQNTARQLWNTISTVLQACSKNMQGVKRETVIGATYGLAMRPLCFAALSLTDLLESLGAGDEKLSSIPLLHFSEDLDDCNSVGLLFVKRVVFLAVHTLYAHQHWEKVVELALRFNSATKHTWAPQLTPVICSAQDKLASRLAQHADVLAAAKREKLPPPAHLDPGPDGYNIYGKMGHSLALTSVPLDTKATLDRVSVNEGSETVLNKARSLLARHIAAQMLQKVNKSSDESVECPIAPLMQVSVVISEYDTAISSLLKSGQREVAVQAMSELGDVLWHSGKSKLAGHWWKEALSSVVGIQDPSTGWRKGLPPAESMLSEFGVWGCLLAALNATKLARYTCSSSLDLRLEYSLLSASLFKAVLTFSLPHPVNDMDFVSYHIPQSTTGAQLTPGLEMFADTHRCDPLAVLAALSWTAQELIQRHHNVKVLPVLWLYHHIAQKVCRDVAHTTLSKIFKLQAMTQLGLFDQAVLILSELLVGAGLPSVTTDHTRLVESHWTALKFNTGAPLTDAKNVKCLQHLMEKGLTNKLKQIYGCELVSWIGLARAQLYTSLAVTATHVTAPVASRGRSATRPQTNVATVAAASPKDSTPSPTGSTRPPENTPTLTKRIKADIKLALLDRAEKELITVFNDAFSSANPEFKARLYLSMAHVALALTQPSIATQLSLSSLRCLQSTGVTDSNLDNSDAKIIPSSSLCQCVADLHLWLEARSVLAKSLVGMNRASGWLNCEEVCGEGCEESEASGDVEMWAEFHLTAATHAVSVEPPNLDLVLKHTQDGLELLNSHSELSPRGQLLSCKLSLMLSDASCLKATEVPKEMVQVFEGLTAMLSNQMLSVGCGAPVNMYQPHRVLLASCKLRLAHTLTMIASSLSCEGQGSSSATNDRGNLISSAVLACEEGLQLLKETAYGNPPLQAELKFHHGLLCGLQPTDEGNIMNFAPLLEATKLVSSQGIDHKLSSSCFCEMAQLYIASSKQAKPSSFKTPHTPGPGGADGSCTPSPSRMLKSPGHVTADREQTTPTTSPRRRGSRSVMSVGRPSTQEQERMSRMEREWMRERGRESYLAWCMIKSAIQCGKASRQLTALSSELHNEEVTKQLPDKILDDLPDFVLLDLCTAENCLDQLATIKGEVPVIETMLPSAQHADTTGLTWFKILGYFSKLLRTCFLQKSLLNVATSSLPSWSLRYSEVTASTFSKCKALFSFLLQHCPSFKGCRLPPLSPLISLSAASGGQRQGGGGGVQSAGGGGGQQSDQFSHLNATDSELTVLWTKPFVTIKPDSLQPDSKGSEASSGACEQGDERKCDDDLTIGYFALNQKAVRTSMPPNISSFGFESHAVKMSVAKLTQLHSLWRELSTTSNTVLVESRSSSRPLSRSPSKQKKMEKPLRVPPELVEQLEAAVIDLAKAFGSTLTRDQIPKLELHGVAAIAEILKPFSTKTVKGEAYFFFRGIFNST